MNRGGVVVFMAVAAATLVGLELAAHARSGTDARVTKGPYLQALGPASVEVRVEVDPPAAALVEFTGVGGGGTPRIVRDEAESPMHVIRLDGLAPGTRYAYTVRVGGGTSQGEFTTAPPAGESSPFTALVYGDNRSDDVAHASVVRAMLASPADFLLNTGDLVADGSSSTDWQSFFDIESKLLRNQSLFACIGNHELVGGGGAEYLRYFGPTFDAAGAGEPPRLYGSFRWSNARFFLLDAMESFESGAERAWLESELARADGEAGLTWRVVVLHHSPWSAGPHGGNARALRAGIPALLAKHHIDLLLAGHDHIYERGFAEGVRYVVTGGGGAPLYVIEKQLESTRKAEAVHHFVELAVTRDALRLVAKRDDGTVLDTCGMASGSAGQGWSCDGPAPAPTEVKATVTPGSAAAPAARCACDVVGARSPDSLLPMSAVGTFAASLLARRRRLRLIRLARRRASR